MRWTAPFSFGRGARADAKRGIGLIALLLMALVSSAWPVHAYQTASGTICVLAFTDINKNGMQETGEPLLNGVNIGLGMAGLMIANHLTDSQGQYCFENLAPGMYTLAFSDPLAQPTTPTTLTLQLNSGEQLTRSFGAVPISNAPQVSTTSQGLVIPLTRTRRLLVAALGAAMMMLFTIGIGLVGYNLYRLRRRNSPTK